MKRFRYPGVRPFEAADRALFFGRDRDIADLYELVRAEPLVVLFGKSGYGKSSLLNAGMLPLFSESTPELRSGQDHDQPEQSSSVQEGDDWTVLETRFGEYTQGSSETPLERLRQRLLEKIPTTTANSLIANPLIPNSLWLDFKQRLTPQKRRFLLVFDQFEEFFSYPPEQQAAFKDQLADLLYEEMPQAIRAAARSLERDERRALAARMEVKALFAIRSDRMSDLDRLKDRLPAILHKRYELRALSREQAREAIVQPALLVSPVSTPPPTPPLKERGGVEAAMTPSASSTERSTSPLLFRGGVGGGVETGESEAFTSPPFEYRDDALQKILDELSRSNAGTDKSGGIESFQLQILCDDIDSRVANGLVPDRDDNGLPDVIAEDLPDFSEVFARYYERRLAHLPENQRTVARRVIEDGLVRYDDARDEGRRLSVDGQALLKDFEAVGLAPALLRELENTFLVRREPNTLGGHNYELSHDTLLAPVISAKKKRLEAEERELLRQERERLNRARRRNAVAGLAALLLLGFAFWQTYAARRATADADKAYQAATEQERKADEATRRAQAAGEEAENARRIAELEKKNALNEQEKAELERRRAAVEQLKAERLLAASRVIAARKLPENFDVLIPLDSLNCEEWDLDSLSPEIGKLKNLKLLNLNQNFLKSLPEEIWDLQNLQLLNLSNNFLKSLPKEIGNLSSLQTLYLNANTLNNLPKEIGNLNNLQGLDLFFNELENLPEEITKLRSLQSINLGGNNLKGLPKEIGNLKQLEYLDISDNYLAEFPEEILSLQNLQWLNLHHNKLRSLPTEIKNLRNLQSLNLENNWLKTLPEEIGNLQNLQSLYLSGNEFISLPIEALKQLKNLKRLVLKDEYDSNPLPTSEVEALRQAMPWCEVVWKE